eukprot:1150319-Pelagomonas_calceolata.AAC.4
MCIFTQDTHTQARAHLWGLRRVADARSARAAKGSQASCSTSRLMLQRSRACGKGTVKKQ